MQEVANHLAEGVNQNKQDGPQKKVLSQTQEDKNGFDPFKRPPDLKFCQLHQKASMIGRVIPDEPNKINPRCPCCNMPTELEKLSMWCDKIEFSYLGSGYVLYFYFMGLAAIILGVMGTGAIASILYNQAGDGPYYPQCPYQDDSNFKMSLMNTQKELIRQDFQTINFRAIGGPVTLKTNLSFAYLLVVLSIMALILKFKLVTKRIQVNIDEALCTESDYTIQVEGIPLEETEDQIKDFFQNCLPNRKIQIEKVNKAYRIGDYTDKSKQIEVLQQKISAKQKAVESGDSSAKEAIITLENEIQKISQEQDVIEKDISNQETLAKRFTGTCYISVQYEQDVEDIVEFWRVKNRMQYILPFGCLWSKNYKGNVIYVQRAPEAQDIIWENIGYSYLEKFFKQLYTFVVTCIVLLICAILIYLLQQAKDKIKGNDQKMSTSKLIQTQILTFVAAYLILLINFIIQKVMRAIARFYKKLKFNSLEKHNTYTNYHISVTKKIGLAQFFNTAIISFLVNYFRRNKNFSLLCDSSGIIPDANALLIANAIMPPLLGYFNIWYYLRIKKQQAVMVDEKCTLYQIQANQIFEGQPIDPAAKFAQIIKTLLLSAFYATVFPIGVFYSLGSMFLLYLVEKVKYIQNIDNIIFKQLIN